MKRIDARTVELTDLETQVVAEFEGLLERGYGIRQAVRRMQMAVVPGDQLYEPLSDLNFVRWLRGDDDMEAAMKRHPAGSGLVENIDRARRNMERLQEARQRQRRNRI